MKTKLAILFCLLCLGAALPKAPKPPKPVLQSPKGKEQSVVRIVVPPIIKTNHITLSWGNPYTNPVAFCIEYRKDITSAWALLGRITNKFTFTRDTTNASELYRVGASWP